MLKQYIEKLKKIFMDKIEGNERKKTIENLIVLGIVLIVTVIFINYIWNNDKTTKKQLSSDKVLAENSKNIENSDIENVINSEMDLENKLASILSKINGVSDVSVMITYSQSQKKIPLYNEDIKSTTTEEKDVSGGVRKITENNSNREVVYDETNGEKNIATQSILNPEIEGAIIIANGTTNAAIKNSIIQAVEAVTGLSTHKIQVFESGQNW